jgi:hypothetical protein
VRARRAADDASALAFVSAIYNSYKPDSDGVRIDSGRKLRRYFEPALAEAMNKDQENAAKHHEEGELGSDPFIDAQDFDIKHFDVAIKDTAPGKVSATGDDRARANRDQKRLADLRYYLAARREAGNIARRISVEAARLVWPATQSSNRARAINRASFSGSKKLARVKGIEPSS